MQVLRITAIKEEKIGMIIKLLTPTVLNHEKTMSCSVIQKTNYPYFEDYGYFIYTKKQHLSLTIG